MSALDQTTLFDVAEFVPVDTAGLTIEEAFLAFHDANRWVYDALVRLAREWQTAGHDRVGIGMLFEVLRWQWHRHTIDPTSEFRLNNNYRSRYARLIAENEPDLADLFVTRELRTP